MTFAASLRVGLAGACALAAGHAAAQEASFASQAEPEVVPGQYIVRTGPGVAAADLPVGLLGEGVTVTESLPMIDAIVIEFEPELEPSLDVLTESALDMRGVVYIEPVYVVRIDTEPNDPEYGAQWGFVRISAPEGWQKRTDAEDVVIAVIDTGVDYRHPDLAANIWTNPGEIPGSGMDDDGNGIVDDVHGANFFVSPPTGDPFDDHGHGTHVAGTVAAVTDNNLGVAGTSWTAQVMPIKFLGADGSGTTAGAIRAIDYAVEMGADIMNNSWGGGGFSRALEEAIQIADDAGILFVAAAGNSNRDNDAQPHYPSSYEVPNVLAVMATDPADARAGFSNFGASSVDVAAPGVDILSTTPGGRYNAFSGTSMAAPHVAGAAALAWAEDPSMSHVELSQHILDTADVIPGLAGRSVTGARINLAAMLDTPTEPEPEPEPEPDPEPEPEPPVCMSENHTQIAYESFHVSDRVRPTQNGNLLSVTFDLPERMVVDIAAHGSARRIAGSGNTIVRTGVFAQEAANVMWTGSYRRANFASAEDNRTVSSHFAIVLPAGTHTIYWKLWVSGATLQFDSGTLTVRGIPCSMGGTLAPDMAAERAPIIEADPALRPRPDRGRSGAGAATTQ